jgi:hypothetical protein
MGPKRKLLMLALGIVLACAAMPPLLLSPDVGKGEEKDFYIRAEQYSYNPHRIVIDRGDKVRIRLASMDVVHGFHLEGHDIEAMIFPGTLPFYLRHPSDGDEYASVEEFVFNANRFGKYRYRCSVTCGPLHPFMLGEMIVRPNYPFMAGMGAAVGVFLAGFVLMFIVGKKERFADTAPSKPPWRLDLLQVFPLVNWIVRRRWLQFALVLPTLALFVVFLIAGFFGSPVGNRNIIITFVWILWWFLLITFMLPFGARVWCLMCPFPFFGEWFQRRRLLGPGPCDPDARSYPMKGFNKRWPRSLSNIWLQNILFLALCTFSAALITRPVVTALALGSMAVIATVMHLIYKKRTFCSYVCPVSGFLGLYSMASVVEVRAKDPNICLNCKDKSGIVGSEQGWACPWDLNPSKLSRNNYCGLCLECIRACPNDCMTLQARPFCSDVLMKGYDEAWKAFIMITIAIAYSIILLGPWGTLKEWVNISEMGNWKGFLTYVVVLWVGALAAMPGLWALAVWFGRSLSGTHSVSAKEMFLKYTYLLVPLGLAAWIAFSLPLILVNTTCILNTVSDPMGWGWDLFGTCRMPWTPILPEYIVYAQIPLLLTGLGFSLKRGYEIAQGIYEDAIQGVRSLIPVGVLCMAITIVFMILFAG